MPDKEIFMAIEKRIGEWWWDYLQVSMKDAGVKEKALTILKNQYHQGVPAIIVIVDGGWCKRTLQNVVIHINHEVYKFYKPKGSSL